MFEKKTVTEEKKTIVKEPKKEKKVKDKEAKKNSSTAMTVKSIVIPLILAAIVVCLIYLVIQKGTESKVVEKTVVCATTEIKANTYIDGKDLSEYLAEVSMDATKIPETAYSNLKALPDGGFYIENKMVANQMVLADDVEVKDAVMDKYVEGTTKTSFAVDAFDNSISGTVRTGDIVDIYAVDPTTESLTLMVSNVYVENAYDSSGAVVEDGAVAVAFTIKVAPEEVEAVNNAIDYGGIQLYLTNN